MKFHNKIKTIILACLIMASNATLAALTFDQWTVTTGGADVGVISGCPTSATVSVSCTTLVAGEGFLQQQVDFAADAINNIPAASYIQTIITDPTANTTDPTTLPYKDESFIQLNGQDGIVAKQNVSDTTARYTFTSSSELYTGWGVNETPTGSSDVNIIQGFSDIGVASVFGDEFTSSFGLHVDLNSAGDQIGKSMTIGQVVEMGGAVDTNNNPIVNTSDVQRFIVEQRSGTLQQAGGNGGFVLGSTTFDASSAPLNGTAGSDAIGVTAGAATWQDGDDVMLVWLGQKISASAPGSSGGLSVFGYESVTVVEGIDPATIDTTQTPTGTAAQFASTFSTTLPGTISATVDNNNPFNWDEVTFGAGTTPILPTPADNTGTVQVPNYVDNGACEVAGSSATCVNQ
jgi:hypothetical protein